MAKIPLDDFLRNAPSLSTWLQISGSESVAVVVVDGGTVGNVEVGGVVVVEDLPVVPPEPMHAEASNANPRTVSVNRTRKTSTNPFQLPRASDLLTVSSNADRA